MTTLNQQIVKRCLQKIKTQLKTKGVLYSDLASSMDVSEVTIKRMLNQNDIGLERLLTLAEISEINLGKLIQETQQPQEHYFFSDRQDEMFDKHPYLLSYFQEIFYLGKKPEQIAKENDLNELSTYLYLRELENIELLELRPDNKFRFLVKAPLGFSPDSRVLKKQITKHINKACEVVMSSARDEEHFMLVKPLHLSKQNYQKMLGELLRTVEKYAEVAEQTANQLKELPDYQITLVGNPLNSNDFEEELIINISDQIFK